MDKARLAPVQEKLRIGPVSGQGLAQLSLPGITGIWLLHIFNGSGGLLQSVISAAGMAILDLSSLPVGNYEVIAVDPFGTTFSGTVLKH